VFGDKQKPAYLLKLNWTPIVRHILVKGKASPDDPFLQEYWERRKKRQIHILPPKWMGLARTQKGKCPQCKSSLFNDEELHIHHVLERKCGGPDSKENLKLMHLYCHQQVHNNREEEYALLDA